MATHICPSCGKRTGGYYSFAPWCTATHWAQKDNDKWEREHGPEQRLDGCICNPVRGAHAIDCPWSM